MATDVEQEALVIYGSADAADIVRILLEDHHIVVALCQGISTRETGRAGANH